MPLGDEQLSLFEDDEQAGWIDAIRRNTEETLENGPFVLIDRLADLYKGTIGLAREKHLRAALTQLHEEGKIAQGPRGVKKLSTFRVAPVPSSPMMP